MEISDILPTNLEIKYNYIKVEDIYVSIVTIIKYQMNIEILKTVENLIGTDEIEIVFHIKRENNFEVLKKLTNLIAESGSEMSSISKNQIDINVLDSVKSKAIELRKKIQIDNEQVYLLSTYVVIKAKNINELVAKQKKYINILYAKQLIAKPSNFRQKDAYLATLPIILNSSLISKYTHSVFTEQALTKLFPFFESDILYKNGILLGKANNNLCTIDIFSHKNNNYNMCIFGSSGAGKSYFVKLMIIKNAYKGIRQIVIDPEGEYVELVESLGGHVYTEENYNPFEINESFLENSDFFNKKLEQVIDYVSNRINMIDKDKLKKCCVKAYNKFGINGTKESLYMLNNDIKLYIMPQYTNIFPTINDLVVEMEQEGIKGIECLRQEGKIQNPSSNVELYCFNLKGKSIEKTNKVMRMFMPKIYELIKSDTLIYFDELWK